MMKKSRIVFASTLLVAVLAACVLGFYGTLNVSAYDAESEQVEIENNDPQVFESTDPETRAFTTMALSIGAENGEVYARLSNSLLIGFGKIQVYLQLFSSLEYPISYIEMDLEAQIYDDDLSINETKRVAAPINGVERYWMARAYYRLNENPWKEKVTDVWLVDINGNGEMVN